MAVTVTEKMESRRLTEGQSAELIYSVKGTADQRAAMNALLAAAPTIFEGLGHRTPSIEPIYVDTENPERGLWLGTVNYAMVQAAGESSFSFEFSGGVQHITQSIQTIGSYAPVGKTAPDFKGAIGVTKDGPQGVDIIVPVYRFAETHAIAAALVTAAYKLALQRATGKVNNATFKGFSAGEVLFEGATGSERSTDGVWEITFKFFGSENKTNIVVGDITVTAKKGWEYLWILYDETEDTTANKIVSRPTAAYVEKVYETADFSTLGIG